MRLDGRMVLSITMVAIFAGFTAIAATYSRDARLAPLVIGILGLVISLAQLVASTRDSRREGSGPRLDIRAGRVMLAWFAGFIITTIAIGIVPAALLMVFAFLRFRGREKRLSASAIAVVFALVIYATFEVALRIPLFTGLLIGRI